MCNSAKASPRRRHIGLSVAALATAGLVAAVSPTIRTGRAAMVADAAHEATVQIANFAFAPPDLTVAAGTTVVWKNADDSPHRVADRNGAYVSAALDTDDSYAHTFATPGVYGYFCSIHPFMKGKITVKPPAPNS